MQHSDEDEVLHVEEVRKYLSEEDDDLLISLVAARPLSFDMRLPLKERAREIINKLWEEIISELNLRITIKEVSSRSKNIRDSFIQVRSNIDKKLASSSSLTEKLKAEVHKEKHKNYHSLQFLEDTLTATSTNVELCGTSPDSMLDSPSTLGSCGNKIKRKHYEDLMAADESFLTRLDDTFKAGAVTQTATHQFCMRLADALVKLPRTVRNKLEIEFLQKVADAEELHANNDNNNT
ncbi:hypothetical protein RN001_005642 [Aquatica leii]|uniref:MADF domain-containing protein n=1 Tax=Aquatica leii TaxID=1421715 RepID=A0AAN7PCZ6_9COLE|nr:hypothetical protein RN001_005642 [Aquatica leii]